MLITVPGCMMEQQMTAQTHKAAARPWCALLLTHQQCARGLLPVAGYIGKQVG
jgi:hypothetical protein